MSVIYSPAWYDDMKKLINDSEEFRRLAPRDRVAMTLEVTGDVTSPYVAKDEGLYWLIELAEGQVDAYRPLPARHDGQGLGFRFTAPATVWESVAAGLLDPITAGLRGQIKVRGDMRFLMKNADAVKKLVELYMNQVQTEWPKGRPPYGGGSR